MSLRADDWLRTRSESRGLALRVSPLHSVRPGLPLIMIIHGDADPMALCDQAARLHKPLDAARVPNGLVSVPGGFHGGFDRDELIRISAKIRAFLLQRCGPDVAGSDVATMAEPIGRAGPLDRWSNGREAIRRPSQV